MRRSFTAVHTVALALWLGALVFSFLLAKTLFDMARPVCPSCQKTTTGEPLVACGTCGALHHGACASAGCAVEHEGSHVLGPASAHAAVTSTSLAHWERVRLREDVKASPQGRLLWRLDATSNALSPEKGEVKGACFELPRQGVGDALGRAFELSQAVAIAMAIASLLTVMLTPPGGALRLVRLLVLVGALAFAALSLSLGQSIATKRLFLDATTVATKEQRESFGATHGLSFGAGLGEALLVLVGLVLALERRDAATPGARPHA